MKKALFAPILGILAITLFSFKPASSGGEGRIIHLADGTLIVPTSVPVTPDDQMKIVSVLQSYGDDFGSAYYTDMATGEIKAYNPTDPSELAAIEAAYPGTGLGEAFSIFIFRKSHSGPDTFTETTFIGSSALIALNHELTPILAKYE